MKRRVRNTVYWLRLNDDTKFFTRMWSMSNKTAFSEKLDFMEREDLSRPFQKMAADFFLL